MKLLFYTPVFAPSVGGIETIVLTLAQGLSRVSTADARPEFEVTLVSQTPAAGFNDDLLPFAVLRRPGLVQLWRLIRSSDVIHIASPSLAPLALGLLAGKPVVVEHHGFQTICPTGGLLIEPSVVPCPGHFMAGRHGKCWHCRSNGNLQDSWRLWLLTFVRRFLCGRIAANIMPTEWLLGLLGLPNAITIPHGVEALSPVVQIQNASRPAFIIFHGRLVNSKGLDILLQALATLRSAGRSFELSVIGDGPERPALENLARKLGLTSCVRFAGRLSASEMESALANARMVVMPSLGGEVFGLVLAENMSRGLAVVASDLGALAEVLGDAGLTFRTGDASDLARQLVRLFDDPELAPRLALRARQRVLDLFSPDGMVEAHAKVYRRMLLQD